MPKKYGVFISYSHKDAEYIDPIIKLISVMRKDLVFQDTRNLMPGKMWEPQVMDALNEAKMVVIFWCKHAADSKYVKKEYEFAIKNNKDVLPLLLDKSKLAKPLSAFQWIDFSHINVHGSEFINRSGSISDEEEFYFRRSRRSTKRFGEAFNNSNEIYIEINANIIADEIFRKLDEKIPPQSVDDN